MKVKKSILSALILSFIVGSVSPVFADSGKLKLIRGKNRIETSMIAAREIKDSQTAVIANAYNFADSLSAFNLVSKFKGKLILIDNRTKVSDELNAITKAYIVGGKSTLGFNLENEVRGNVPEVYRIAGKNRYETNKATLKEAGFKEVGVADGRNFPDALSASGFLAKNGMGLMLVNGANNYHSNYPVKYTFGGENSVAYARGTRIAGKNRYETSEKINSMFSGDLKAIADGSNFADALSAVNITSLGTTNVILAHNNLSDTASSYAKNGKKVYLIGGLLSNNIVNRVYSLYGENSAPTINAVNGKVQPQVNLPAIGADKKVDTTLVNPSNQKPTVPKKEEPKTVQVGKVTTTPIKGNWVKKERNVKEKISDAKSIESEIIARPVIRYYNTSPDIKTNYTLWFEDAGIMVYDPERSLEGNEGETYSREFLKFTEDLIKRSSEENKQKFIDTLIHKYKVNPEVARNHVQAVVNTNAKMPGYDHNYDPYDLAYMIQFDQELYLKKGLVDEKGENSTQTVPFIIDNDFTVAKYKYIPARYNTYKVTWEENTLTHEKRNETKIKINSDKQELWVPVTKTYTVHTKIGINMSDDVYKKYKETWEENILTNEKRNVKKVEMPLTEDDIWVDIKEYVPGVVGSYDYYVYKKVNMLTHERKTIMENKLNKRTKRAD